MAYRVTFCGLLLTFSVIGCRAKERTATPPAPAPAAPSEAAPAAEAACVPTSPDEVAREPWLEQLPKILRYEFKVVEKVGLVATPLCVNDRAHTEDWNEVVTTEGFFASPKFELEYAASAKQVLDKRPNARRITVQLKNQGSRWVGKMNEIKRSPDLVAAMLDAVLDFVLPLERDLDLPSCTKAQMDAPMVVPAPPTPTCP